MANLIAVPSDWMDNAGNSPPACWDGAQYTIFNDVQVLNLKDDVSIAEGDKLAFTATCTLGQSHIEIEYIGVVDGQDQTIYLVNDDLAVGSKSYDVQLPVGGRAYEIRIDAGFGCSSDTVTLVPTAATPAPIAPDETINVIANSSNNAIEPVITQNGSQVTPDGLDIDASPAHGSASVSGTSLLYTPTADYSGPDSFTYHATAGGVASNTATVNITVVAPTPATNYNCNCDDDYPTLTLDEIRSQVYAGLGFLDPLTNAPSKTLAELRTDVFAGIGLIDPISAVPTKSLGDVRAALLSMLGFSAQVSPPGVTAMLNAFINEAQQTLWRRVEMDKGSTAIPAWMIDDATMTTLDCEVVQMLAAALAKAYYQQPDAKIYSDQAENYLSATAARRPPNISAQVDNAIKQARQAVYRRYESGNSGALSIPAFEADDDQTVVDYYPVYLLATATLKASAGKKDAEAIMNEYERYMADQEKRFPPNAKSIVTNAVITAQALLYRRYSVFRLERWFTWNLVPGTRFYDFAENADACTKKMDPRRVTWVGISQGDDNWRPLHCGIEPTRYSSRPESIPDSYEIRQCIEIWPAPSDATWQLRIKGDFGLLPFAADADVNTIDVEAIQLLALANAKAHYGQPDAGNYMSQLTTLIGDLTAGSHHTRRYIPGAKVLLPATRPRLVD